MAPHASLWLVSRGINIGLSTRVYFGDETALNAEDPVLRMIEPAIRRDTLIATRGERDGCPSTASIFGYRARTRPSSSTSRDLDHA